MIRRAVLCLSLVVAAAGCSSHAELGARESAMVAAAPYPALAPLDELIASSRTESRAAPAEREVAARAAGLRARADSLRRRSTE